MIYGSLSDPHHSRENIRMIGEAVRKGWMLPEEAADRLPETALRQALNESSGDRERVAWAKVLVAMDRNNLVAEANRLKAESMAKQQGWDQHLHLHNGPTAAEVARELLASEGFVEASRQEVAQRVGASPVDHQPGHVRGDG